LRGRGIVSIAVLWALALSAFLLLSTSMLVKLRSREVYNHEQFVRAGFAARSGIMLAAAELSQPAAFHALDDDGNLFFGRSGGKAAGESPEDIVRGSIIEEEENAPPRRDIVLGEGTGVSYEIIDEERKINVNRVSEEVLGRLFTLLGLNDPVGRGTAVDSIMDWLDPNSLHRLNGAEDDYYLSLRPAHRARNGPLVNLEELLLIRGITWDLYYGVPGEERVGLVDLVTVESIPGKINLNTAGPIVLSAWFGAEIAKQVLSQRENEVYLVGSHGLSDTFTVTSTGLSGKLTRTTRALLRKEKEPLAWRVVGWYDDYRIAGEDDTGRGE
jgi:type II secretory pathway component PulK